MCISLKDILDSLALACTAISAVAAAYALFTWKKEARYAAVSTWFSNAVRFRGDLNFIYKEKLSWNDEKDKEEIERLSKSFWEWNATWPAAKASLSGSVLQTATNLWEAVFVAYSSIMRGEPSFPQLNNAVEAIYNSDLLRRAGSWSHRG